MKCVYVFLIAAVAFVGASPSDCFKACPKIYDPVCAFDGDSFKVFNNECLMEEAGCMDARPWSLASMDECRQMRSDNCNRKCPKIYNPVCGFNGDTYKVFVNECLMKLDACTDAIPWTMVSFQKCFVKSLDSCEKPCTKEYVPVCGFNGDSFKVFSNKCVMENEECKDNKPWIAINMINCSIQQSSVSNKGCNLFCPLNYAPVCGFNGEKYHIFGNMCDFESSDCMDSYTWHQLTLADCEAHGLKAW